MSRKRLSSVFLFMLLSVVGSLGFAASYQLVIDVDHTSQIRAEVGNDSALYVFKATRLVDFDLDANEMREEQNDVKVSLIVLQPVGPSDNAARRCIDAILAPVGTATPFTEFVIYRDDMTDLSNGVIRIQPNEIKQCITLNGSPDFLKTKKAVK